MTFARSIKTCFSKYVTFSGRALRSEYWWFVLFFFIGNLVMTVLDSTLFGTVTTTAGGFSASTDTPIFSVIFGLALILPSLSVLVRRLHDVGKSGWWYWIILVPIVGFILLIVWLASEGSKESNQYGPAPGNEPGSDDEDGLRPSPIPTVSHDQ
ncbi:MAG: DUF805 domain-containing protein [Paracoccaceae bacterium]